MEGHAQSRDRADDDARARQARIAVADAEVTRIVEEVAAHRSHSVQFLTSLRQEIVERAYALGAIAETTEGRAQLAAFVRQQVSRAQTQLQAAHETDRQGAARLAQLTDEYDV